MYFGLTRWYIIYWNRSVGSITVTDSQSRPWGPTALRAEENKRIGVPRGPCQTLRVKGRRRQVSFEWADYEQKSLQIYIFRWVHAQRSILLIKLHCFRHSQPRAKMCIASSKPSGTIVHLQVQHVWHCNDVRYCMILYVHVKNMRVCTTSGYWAYSTLSG